ncbi:hypothetical protein [Pelagicoccus sp. SDUM812003]|uniref:hypothetical protein n=1 Tax=Pelagicoccus sp. SDUM812003 TaxID=3041267 RepID=UPI00280EF141|nr:hypothetical protein [Pelagicoccus sp. SDUM812003]MDQ8201551.1 hypothetical protein [Pelagicoccus sp. SDUM812003]
MKPSSPLVLLLGLSVLLLGVSTQGRAAPKWLVGQSDGFVVYSNDSARATRGVVEELRDARSLFEKLFPSFGARRSIPIRVVVCSGSSTIKTFSRLYEDKPTTFGGLFFNDFEGPTIIINTSGDWEFTRQTVYHEYIHYLTSHTNRYLPPWLSEGLAELFSTIEPRTDGRIEVGNPVPYGAQTYQENKPIPFERFFTVTRYSPEYNSRKHGRGQFYAQSWLLLHYLKFGETDLPETALGALVKRALLDGIVTETTLQETLGMDYDQLGRELDRYSRRGTFLRRIYELSQEERHFELDLRRASEGEVNLLIGSLLLYNRGPSEAYSKLAYAAQQLPDSPLAHAYQGYHALRQDQPEYALESFGKAVELGSESPHTLVAYVRSWIKVHDPSGSISRNLITKEDTSILLGHLFKARQIAGAFDKGLYQQIGAVWLRSKVEPNDKHMGALSEGLSVFPEDDLTAYYLALYFERAERYPEAKAMVDRYYPHSVSGEALQAYRKLDQRLVTRLAAKDGSGS